MLCKTLTAAFFFRKLFLTEERPHFVLNNKAMSNGRGHAAIQASAADVTAGYLIVGLMSGHLVDLSQCTH